VVRKHAGIMPPVLANCKGKDNIKMDLKETACESISGFICLKISISGELLWNCLQIFGFHKKNKEFIKYPSGINFKKRNLFHVVN